MPEELRCSGVAIGGEGAFSESGNVTIHRYATGRVAWAADYLDDQGNTREVTERGLLVEVDCGTRVEHYESDGMGFTRKVSESGATILTVYPTSREAR